MSPNARRGILEKVLRDGAAWEEPTIEIIAKVSKKKKNFAKARIGSKAAKQAERMDLCGEDLDEEASTMYRALSARLLYLSMDRPEVAYAAKELCRHFAHPTKTGVGALKRGVRFLVGLPRLVWHFPFQDTQKTCVSSSILTLAVAKSLDAPHPAGLLCVACTRSSIGPSLKLPLLCRRVRLS